MVDCTLTESAGGTPFDREGDDLGPTDYRAYGCNGAWMRSAWLFQKDHGAILEEDYPYTSGDTGTEGACRHNEIVAEGGEEKIVGYIEDWTRIKSVDYMKYVVT